MSARRVPFRDFLSDHAGERERFLGESWRREGDERPWRLARLEASGEVYAQPWGRNDGEVILLGVMPLEEALAARRIGPFTRER